MNNNKGYIFQDYFDVFCYLVITTIFPALTFYAQSNQINVDVTSKLSCIDTGFFGFFWVATFYYDFYQRYRECNNQSAIIVNILFLGRTIFGILVVVSFLFLFIVSEGVFPSCSSRMIIFFKHLHFGAIYPFVIAVCEILRRMNHERKGKISKVKV